MSWESEGRIDRLTHKWECFTCAREFDVDHYNDIRAHVLMHADEQIFNAIKDRLIVATGSPGLTSFHDGKVHMTLSEWERLVGFIEAPPKTAFSDPAPRSMDELPVGEPIPTRLPHELLSTIVYRVGQNRTDYMLIHLAETLAKGGY